MTSNTTIFSSSTAYRHHKKRLSSTFPYQSRLLMDTSHRNIYNNYSLTNAKHSQDFDFTGEEIPKRSSKHQYIMKPWTNAEQESLYVAVERLKLFGQWDKVRRIMNLDRTTKDIEEEYTRLYAEIPDSDQELLMDHEYEQEHNQMLGYETAPPTPSLTATSSATPSARSSQDNMAVLFDRSKEFTRYSVLEGLQVKEEDEADEEDIEDQQQQPQQNIQYASTEARTVRMVRVWTPEQSENLKKLIEVYFPGAYRINWVWIAAQMGNAFTRKQCKNKWEIMRRRMGTDDEINLLKQGYQEFGPSWGQIQEKYLPERSRGGISIMWDLLETRKTEQQQQQGQQQKHSLRKAGSHPTCGPYHGRYHSMSSLRVFQRPGRSKESPTAHDSMGSKYIQQDPNPCRKQTVTSDIDPIDLSARLLISHSMNKGVQMQPPFTSNGVSRHTRHGSDITWLHSSVTWSDRNYPMTWTEPLTRRLEELVQQNFPNHQKVNWAKISSLMGSNPVISRDQCKRRWYLISQNNHLQHHHSYRLDDSSVAMETDQVETAVNGVGSLAGSPSISAYDS